MGVDYARLKLDEIKGILKARGLKISGSKNQLVKRLQEDDEKTLPETNGEEVGEKRAAEEPAAEGPPAKKAKTEGVRAILMDIEGTTTPISFVHDKLFPYAKERLKAWVNEHWDTPDCQECLRIAEEEAKDEEKPEERKEWFIGRLRNAMEKDLKLTSLKKLQGILWKDGYESGELKGEIFEDVPIALKRWQEDRKLYIYSSGSIAAQKLIFGKSIAGDLTTHLSDYFDTTTGPKIEASSYIKIATAVDLEPASMLFLTDIPKEANAAKEAGFKTALLERPGNGALTEEDRQAHPVLKSFEEVDAHL